MKKKATTEPELVRHERRRKKRKRVFSALAVVLYLSLIHI